MRRRPADSDLSPEPRRVCFFTFPSASGRSASGSLLGAVSDAPSSGIGPAAVYLFLSPQFNEPPIRGQKMKWGIDGVGSRGTCNGMQPLCFANVHVLLSIMHVMPTSCFLPGVLFLVSCDVLSASERLKI